MEVRSGSLAGLAVPGAAEDRVACHRAFGALLGRMAMSLHVRRRGHGAAHGGGGHAKAGSQAEEGGGHQMALLKRRAWGCR